MGAKEKHKSTSRTARKRTSKTSSKKKTAKKTVKKTTKKTTKKTVKKAKKVTKKTTKKTTKQTTSKTKETPKTTAVEKEQVWSHNQVVSGGRRLVSPLVPRIQTMAASVITHTPQVPLNVHAFMTTTARVSGVAFVVLGAFFTAVLAANMPYSEGQAAQLVASTKGVETTNYDLDVESSYEVAENDIGVTLTVTTKASGAEKVYISARNKETQELLPLGEAKEGASGEFSFSYDFRSSDIEKEFKIRVDVWHDLSVDEVQAEYIGTIEVPASTGGSVSSVETDIADSNLDTEAASESTSSTAEAVAIPVIRLDIPDDAVYTEEVELYAKIENAQKVEWYAIPAGAAVKRFLGKGVIDSGDKWSLTFNTENLPNGVYSLLAEADTVFGTITSDKYVVTVENVSDSTSDRENLENLVAKVQEEWDETESEESEKVEVIDTTEEEDEEEVGSAEVEDDKESLSDMYDERLNALLNRLTVAKRNENEKTIKYLEQELSVFELEIATDLSAIPGSDERLAIADYIAKKISAHELKVSRQTQFIKERNKADVLQDTDGDGVSDYDEVTLFATDPTVADTDVDGVLDGIEIEGGYDPLDASPRRALVYESPKEYGVERSDVLTVDSFTPVKQEDAESTQIEEKKIDDRLIAHVTGKALPHSFVTLYVYSTPVVVTVKTDKDGNWEYTFDKELEDGEHTVYVGITDNAGQIVAKSAPYRFIKEAQAVTPIAQAAIDENILTSEQSTFASERLMLIIAAVSVVALGLVLILLGVFLESRQPRVRREAVPISVGI